MQQKTDSRNSSFVEELPSYSGNKSKNKKNNLNKDRNELVSQSFDNMK